MESPTHDPFPAVPRTPTFGRSLVAAWWLVAVLLAAGEAPGKAPPEMLGFFDAAQLGEFCNATGEQARDGHTICLSYVTGVMDQLLSDQALGAPSHRTICVPRDISAAGVMQAVTAYAAWSKSAKGVSGAHFVRYAMEQAYPCSASDLQPM